ncbi:unnamed protein product [Adineta steineri]|uniref:Uncharacterized protein n=1 Tax=Adineta steineri TaxID=433720 RepID=A0A815U2J6_9BILA|nr:unnamed protein product [Adineta steineri]CAF4193975.1 unnamed protein product [Adineta steineri]
MSTSFYTYETVAYAVPFSMFGVMFVIMSILNKRAHSYAVEHILGIKLKAPETTEGEGESKDKSPGGGSTEKPGTKSSKKNSQHSQAKVWSLQPKVRSLQPEVWPLQPKVWSLQQNTEMFLYIEQEHNEQEKDKQGLPCILRFLCDFFTSAILAILLEIIFSQCILSYESILANSACPDFDADCFGYNGTLVSGPFLCTKNAIANFSETSPKLNCYGWVYKTITTNDALNSIGVSGGLLGLISCIVPLVFYLSYFRKKCWGISILCIILPACTIVAFILVSTLLIQAPERPSVLTVLTFSLFITMTSGGWGWAVYTSWSRRSKSPQPWCSTEPSFVKKHCSFLNYFITSYPLYPFCCCGESEKFSCFKMNTSSSMTV